jgi:hypothetical protein
MIVGDSDKSYGGHKIDAYYIQMAAPSGSLWAPMSYITDNLFGTLEELYKNDKFVIELIALLNNRERPFTHFAKLLCSIERKG